MPISSKRSMVTSVKVVPGDYSQGLSDVKETEAVNETILLSSLDIKEEGFFF